MVVKQHATVALWHIVLTGTRVADLSGPTAPVWRLLSCQCEQTLPRICLRPLILADDSDITTCPGGTQRSRLAAVVRQQIVLKADQ